MGELTSDRGKGIKIWWEGHLLGGFSQVGGMSKLSAGGRGLSPLFPVGKPIYIYTIVSAYVLIPVIISVSQGTEKLNTLPQAHKNP